MGSAGACSRFRHFTGESIAEIKEGGTGRNPCAALNQQSVLLFVRLVGFRFRLGLWFRLACSRWLRFVLRAGLGLRDKEHPRATVQVDVLPRRSDHRTLRGVRGCRAQVQTVKANNALAV